MFEPSTNASSPWCCLSPRELGLRDESPSYLHCPEDWDRETTEVRDGQKGRTPHVQDTAERAAPGGVGGVPAADRRGRLPRSRAVPAGAVQPYRSALCNFLRGHSDVVLRLAVDMYACGLSTRDIEAAFTDEQGDCLLSRSAVWEHPSGTCQAHHRIGLRSGLLSLTFMTCVTTLLPREQRQRDGATPAIIPSRPVRLSP
jgi:hypothetical protein